MNNLNNMNNINYINNINLTFPHRKHSNLPDGLPAGRQALKPFQTFKPLPTLYQLQYKSMVNSIIYEFALELR
jgi:hypothetical protein